MASAGNKLTDKFSRIAALRPARTLEPIAPPTERESDELAQLLGATAESNRFGEHLALRRWFATPEPFFEAGDSCIAKALQLLLAKSRANTRALRAANDPQQWLFLDTETTGLSGGSGMYAFLIGLAWWDSGGLQVEQLFMRDHNDEYALLETLRKRMAERSVLVTFNGKTFDWPLLKTRYVMTRTIAPHPFDLHLDFLHPARQIWRPRLLSVRLAELEEHVLHVSPSSRLDWTREADIDGSMIPQLYFDYVRRGAAQPLVPVFQHNQMDLRGLAAIAGRVIEVLAGACNTDSSRANACQLRDVVEDSHDLFGVSRLLVNRGANNLAQKSYEAAILAGLPVGLARRATRDLAKIAKRAGDHAKAAELWESLLEPRAGRVRARRNTAGDAIAPQSLTLERILLRGMTAAAHDSTRALREQLEACEELAIHFERRARDLDRAIQITRHGIALVKRAKSARRADRFAAASGINPEFTRIETRMEKRLTRLLAKFSINPESLLRSR
ncbi:MAG TPA: ribonuclease H-like domain-containing protein [Candidatus Acidoferrales bacterium]|nr:ribonuclease H-like domain-containing protein [Candidatus Acidoferrales bacterium]